jgi:hypothetical protein
LDRYDAVDGEQVYSFTRDEAGSGHTAVVALLFGNVVGHHGREWLLVEERLRNLRAG